MAGRADRRIMTHAPRLPPAALQDEGLMRYLAEIGALPLLTADEEQRYGTRAQAGDQEARRRLIDGNLRLVVSIAATYHPQLLTLGDLIGEGNAGLVRAVDRYRPRPGTRFASYAGWWIRQAISRAIATRDQLIAMPAYVYLAHHRARREAARAELESGTVLADMALAIRCNVTLAQLAYARGAPRPPRSLDERITQIAHGAATREDAGTLGDLTPSDWPTPDEEVELAEERDERATWLQTLMAQHLTRQERRVLRLRYWAVNPRTGANLTPAEVAARLRRSRQRVQQIEEHALAKLRRAILMEAEGRRPTPDDLSELAGILATRHTNVSA